MRSTRTALSQLVATRIQRLPGTRQTDREMARELWSRARNEAIVGTWWPWAGHLGRLGTKDESRLCHIAATWRDAWWKKAVRGLLHQSTDPERSRLNRGHRQLGKRMWDDVTQRRVEENGARRTLAGCYCRPGPVGDDGKGICTENLAPLRVLRISAGALLYRSRHDLVRHFHAPYRNLIEHMMRSFPAHS